MFVDGVEEVDMIPKIIHYCWFGGAALPKKYESYLDSWKYYCPDYEIKRWDETNFDIECCQYVKEAYQSKKWAFVADYARFFVLYKYGGIYFDTDVEILRPLDDLLKLGNFMGMEYYEDGVAIAPGLGLAAESGLKFYKDMLNLYGQISFYNKDGSLNTKTVVEYTTEMMAKYGNLTNNKINKICDINIFPVEYFCPMNSATGEINITDKTYTIHHYSGSWMDWENRFYYYTKRKFAGSQYKQILIMIIFLPLRLYGKIKLLGLKKTCSLIMRHLVGK